MHIQGYVNQINEIYDILFHIWQMIHAGHDFFAQTTARHASLSQLKWHTTRHGILDNH